MRIGEQRPSTRGKMRLGRDRSGIWDCWMRRRILRLCWGRSRNNERIEFGFCAVGVSTCCLVTVIKNLRVSCRGELFEAQLAHEDC